MNGKREKPPIPISVIITIILEVLFLILNAYGLIQQFTWLSAVGVAVAIIFIVGLYIGHPLAFQWAVFINALIVVIGFLSMGMNLISGDTYSTSVLLTGIIGLFILPLLIVILLYLKSSLAFFDLKCPSCGSFKYKAKGFLFNQIKCRSCGKIWKHRGDFVS